MKLVLAGGAGSLGRRVADDAARRGHDVVILTRSRKSDIDHRQAIWNGRDPGPWVSELEGSVVLNLAGELVDRRPTPANIELLRRSRVEPTQALVAAVAGAAQPPALWLQMSTLAIYGDGGDDVIDERHRPAEGPPQMAGVARAWEAAADGARADRLVVLRTGIVLDAGAPAMQTLGTLTRWGLGGRMSDGNQWVSWIHLSDFLRALWFVVDEPTLDGIVHVTSPNAVRNRDLMTALRTTLHRPWSPPTPRPLVHLGARLLRTDPGLALIGRRCIPQRLLDAGLTFQHPDLEGALHDLIGRPAA